MLPTAATALSAARSAHVFENGADFLMTSVQDGNMSEHWCTTCNEFEVNDLFVDFELKLVICSLTAMHLTRGKQYAGSIPFVQKFNFQPFSWSEYILL